MAPTKRSAVAHPDMRLIESAPDLLKALVGCSMACFMMGIRR